MAAFSSASEATRSTHTGKNCPVEKIPTGAYHHRMKRGFILLPIFLSLFSLPAAVHFDKVEYKAGDTVCEGLLVQEDQFKEIGRASCRERV